MRPRSPLTPGSLSWGAASSAPPSPITSRTWAGRTSCCSSATVSELGRSRGALYGRLEAEAGQPAGLAPIGFIEVASDRDRLEEYRRVSAFNRYCGVDVHELSPREVKELFPLARVDDIEAGF